MIRVILLLFIIVSICASCERRDLYYDTQFSTAKIPVEIDWSKSGLNPSLGRNEHMVHIASFRFYPKDGSAPFEEYLEENVSSGIIEVPVGEYDIIVMNEYVDAPYWEEFFTFDGKDKITTLTVSTLDDDPSAYDAYIPSEGEYFAKEAHRLASFSINDYSVTREMVTRTRSAKTRAERDEFTLKVAMRAMTYQTEVVVNINNIHSVQWLRGAARGFSRKRHVTSNKSADNRATIFFTLNNRQSLGENTGTMEYTFNSFGRLEEDNDYSIILDVILVDGTRYTPDIPLDFDISDQINASIDLNIKVDINIDLPDVDGDIGVGEWDDDNITII